MIKGLEHVAFEVSDLAAVRRFYQDTLGLTVSLERELPPGGRVRGLLFLEGKGFKLEFLDVPGAKVDSSFHLAFEVASMSKTVEAFKALGLEQVGSVTESPYSTPEAKSYRTVFVGPVGERLELMGPD